MLENNIDALLQASADGKLKFVFCGGKGGVGKTTSSSAIATLLATKCAKRTLLVSTDPAHSLGDAFHMEFGSQPVSPLPRLSVIEIDPSESMKKALESWSGVIEDFTSSEKGNDKEDSFSKKIASFQQWLSGIPGIDEATALSEAIEHIESDNYDIIVFDTAPTGHTLKLLALPDILQAGIEKLQSWQTTLWSYWDAFKGLTSTGSTAEAKRRASMKEEVAEKLENYKRKIQKVALMLQDQNRTRFVVVCIAEYLSISETKRLLTELKANSVRASHIIVNQLVVDTALLPSELEQLESLAEVGGLGNELQQDLLQKTVHACRLTTSRKVIQTKYLNQLKTSGESKLLEGIAEVPLLPEEVTGIEALQRFGSLLICNSPTLLKTQEEHTESEAKPLYDDQLSNNHSKGSTNTSSYSNDKKEMDWTPTPGEIVKVRDLAKASQYNGFQGEVVSGLDTNTGRYGVEINLKGKRKVLALQPKNFSFVTSKKRKESDVRDDISADGPPTSSSSSSSSSTTTMEAPSISISDSPQIDMTLTSLRVQQLIEDDPELKQLIDGNQKFTHAIQECMENPINAIKYLGDPEMSPLVSKIMSKMGGVL